MTKLLRTFEKKSIVQQKQVRLFKLLKIMNAFFITH
jgi:hypothetical protein